ncbi:NADH dehydrogenase [ubiquinone] 1 beta subcomplex subunit 3 isoform X1 [Athalia rosae]|uniref:NADH dehydrogenase [ubiquinone] 1 beta subcomplex subunit 3 isoform X1 n=2 Tax=Athalia rosae TaxID=37344 RepID=UPI0020334F6D|nr:NADH dehydrogenase [ubiquinone] 1 beta subcomplex subunit 3 isoform X1 [Athalia rosae]
MRVMGGHDHHGPPFVVPKDPSIYKLENAPQLVLLQKKLAEHGLKDPWIRNEIWRYDVTKWGTQAGRVRQFFLMGARVGIPLFLITIAAEKALGIDYSHHHGHGENHHGSHSKEH